jgi:hypothetical protein
MPFSSAGRGKRQAVDSGLLPRSLNRFVATIAEYL